MNRLLLSLIRILHRAYKLLLSPWIGNQCRFEPTCSDYTLEACEVHGAVKGSLLGIWRVLRCNPFSQGGDDPVPRKIFSGDK